MSLGNNNLNKNCLFHFGNNDIFRFSQKYSKNFNLQSLALSVKKLLIDPTSRKFNNILQVFFQFRPGPLNPSLYETAPLFEVNCLAS